MILVRFRWDTYVPLAMAPPRLAPARRDNRKKPSRLLPVGAFAPRQPLRRITWQRKTHYNC